METNKPLTQEDRIMQFKADCAADYFERKESLHDVIVKAIQFGSELRAERAKEKIEHLFNKYDYEGHPAITAEQEILQAIEESGI